jgi:hypothetical protein
VEGWWQVEYLVNSDRGLSALLQGLKPPQDYKLLEALLKAIEQLIQSGRTISADYVPLIRDTDCGEDAISELQDSDNEKVAEKARRIIDTYFDDSDEEEEEEELVLEEEQRTTSFGFGVGGGMDIVASTGFGSVAALTPPHSFGQGGGVFGSDLMLPTPTGVGAMGVQGALTAPWGQHAPTLQNGGGSMQPYATISPAAPHGGGSRLGPVAGGGIASMGVDMGMGVGMPMGMAPSFGVGGGGGAGAGMRMDDSSATTFHTTAANPGASNVAKIPDPFGQGVQAHLSPQHRPYP